MWLCLDISRSILKHCRHPLRTLLTPDQPLFQTETDMTYLSISANFDYPTNNTLPQGVKDHIFDFLFY